MKSMVIWNINTKIEKCRGYYVDTVNTKKIKEYISNQLEPLNEQLTLNFEDPFMGPSAKW